MDGNFSIEINNCEKSFNILKKNTAYLPQYDIIYGNLKLKNQLFYIAALINPEYSLDELKEKVTNVLYQMELFKENCKKIQRLSGGQRKRANIACKLLRKQASLFILDEPTSGLDLDNDYKIMQLLKKLCIQGHTVICTTHNLSTIELFDQVIILQDGKIKQKTTPHEIIYNYNCGEMGNEWRKIYESKNSPIQNQKAVYNISPPLFLNLSKKQWWLILMRRFEDFLNSSGAWFYLLSILLFIPLFIGLSIWTAYPIENGDEKRFFLCSVASFWLGMSFASQEFYKERFKIFLHEKISCFKIKYFFFAYFIFYSLISLAQTLILISPSLYLLRTSYIFLGLQNKVYLSMFVFSILVWIMGVSGTIVGLSMSLLENSGVKFFPLKFRLKIATSVTVPCITVFQLLFSQMVMGEILEKSSYFSLKINDIRDFCYLLTFSRYTDMAFRAYYNLGNFGEEFFKNISSFFIIGLLIPCLLLFIFLYKTKPYEQ